LKAKGKGRLTRVLSKSRLPGPSSVTEADTCRKYVVPKLQAAGWDNDPHTIADAKAFAAELRRLRAARRNGVMASKSNAQRRIALTKAQRAEVLRKAGGRCHICGGLIYGSDWEADHVFAHCSGGSHTLDNYLPAHSICNNYRWYYGTQEFQWILKLGVWLRTKIERQETIGLEAAEHFIAHERRRAKRRKRSTTRSS